MASKHKIENDIERYLVKELKKLGIPCIKFVSTISGEPDRLCFPGNGNAIFIETKVRNNKLSAHQEKRHQFWKNKFYMVFTANTKELVDSVVSFIADCDIENY